MLDPKRNIQSKLYIQREYNKLVKTISLGRLCSQEGVGEGGKSTG